MSDGNDRWKVDELAERAGVSPRTVRYYVQRGLLPAPVFRGRDTVYGPEHLVRLQAIRRLQDAFLPLDAIQSELDARGLDAIARIAAGELASVGVGRREEKPPARVAPGSVARGGEAWQRWELSPGLEVHLSDRADAATRALAEELRAHAARRRGHGGSKR